MKTSTIGLLGALALAGASAWFLKRSRKTGRLTANTANLSNDQRHLNPVFSKLKTGS